MATKPAITPWHVVIATLQTGVPFTQRVMVTAVRMDLSNHVIPTAADQVAAEGAQVVVVPVAEVILVRPIILSVQAIAAFEISSTQALG